MRISTIGYTMRQGIKNIGRNKLFSLASIATMSACIFIFGLFFAIVLNFSHIVEKAEEGVAITIFFDEEADQTTFDSIEKQLMAREDVTEVKFVSAEEAWEKFQQEYFEEALDLSEGFKDNPLAKSANFEVYMADVSTQSDLVSFAENLDGVRKVNRSDTVAKTLTSINRLVGYVSIVIIGILLSVSVFLISNTVTMGITVRSEEIAIMKYIGAKDSFVRGPFVTEGLIIGFVGAVIPLTLLFFSYERAIEFIKGRFSLLRNIIDFIPVTEVYEILLPVGLALGVGIGFLGSFITIHKHLRV